eukprot:TRINITY_DN6096_c0_g1_i1.p1 TRINITY_DN6096_c0_g1~~TRINITY_DN6096_c0_g1_i1.p1  ORF type:complete len:676 (-),score=108.50 TRINITY_DN6096_c0_g1_i1:224-2251(-)
MAESGGTILDYLTPMPQKIFISSGKIFQVPSKVFLFMEQNVKDKMGILKLKEHLRNLGVVCEEIAHISESKGAGKGIILSKKAVLFDHQEAYKLIVERNSISVIGSDDVGLHYGLETLCQLLIFAHRLQKREEPVHIPACQIVDYPNFLYRGVMLDISRDKVPSMETLKRLVDIFSSLKYNQLQLYMEHTFAYQGHEDVWKDSSPIRPEEMRELFEYCQQRYIELVPNQNSFGHMHRWLVHPKYKVLAEFEEGVDHGFSMVPEPYSLNPLDPLSLVLLKDLYSQILACCPGARYINVGLDEAFELGMGKSKKECEEKGVGRVYLEFLLKVHKLLKLEHPELTMQYWGDTINNYPELIPDLPKDSVVLDWGYESHHPFERNGKEYSSSGLPFYVCPGTNSWNSISGRTDNMIGNLRSAAIHGYSQGALGYLVCDWGDHGHWQTLPVSYPGFLVGAGFAWNVSTAEDTQWDNEYKVNPAFIERTGKLLDLLIFQDKTLTMGKVMLDLGNAYQKTGVEMVNQTVLWRSIMFRKFNPTIPPQFLPKIKKLEETLLYIEKVQSRIDQADLETEDSSLIKQEVHLTAEMLKFATKVALLYVPLARAAIESESMDLDNSKNNQGVNKYPPLSTAEREKRLTLAHELSGLLGKYKYLWRRRNRKGGLKDSVVRLDHLLNCLSE